MAETPDSSYFTGRRRERGPKRSVLVGDRVARWLITGGGIGSIVAVSLVGVFLVWVVLPLFKSPSMPAATVLPHQARDSVIRELGINDYATLTWLFTADGTFVVQRLDDGSVLQRLAPFGARQPTAWAFDAVARRCSFGFDDGSVQFGDIRFAVEYAEPEDLPAEFQDLPAGALATLGDRLVERTPENQFRLQTLLLELGQPLALADTTIVQLDHAAQDNGDYVAVLSAAGELHVARTRHKRNLLTGEIKTRLRSGRFELDTTTPPQFLCLSGLGDQVYLAWRDGRLARLEVRDLDEIRLVETCQLLPGADTELTALGFQMGKASLVAGDSDGGIGVWFLTRLAAGQTADGRSLARAHELPAGSHAVRSLAASARTRMLAAGFDDGSIALYHTTSNRRLAVKQIDADNAGDAAAGSIAKLVLGPRDDALLAATGNDVALWRVDAEHPEITASTLLWPVWYEGYDSKALVWQSSGATDDFEPKYSLAPLIFGTLKATLYSLLFGLPLALLAAIYTSEFMHPRLKARVKPAIEMMASLPSVVLGFLAALVFAPFIELVLPHTLVAFVTVPLAIIVGAHLWQLIPVAAATRLAVWRLLAMFLMLVAGLWLAGLLGAPVERSLFAGDVVAWLDGQIGSGLGGWLLLLVPTSALLVFWVTGRSVDPWLRKNTVGLSHTSFALVNLGKLFAGTLAAFAVALLMSWLLTSSGFDPRGSYVDTYVQRNALVVGFVMGFAIIPIIYTISEDALSAVPDHLRAASLGAGATPWQTAIRVVIPPATSGLFSAAMIGLGRAVGETMIVLMAAGNTPVLEWNIFNGFRTLAANIAVELPEAVRDSSHYRTLFLAALTLFAITFVLNTVAEMVRIRFRKKSVEL